MRRFARILAPLAFAVVAVSGCAQTPAYTPMQQESASSAVSSAPAESQRPCFVDISNAQSCSGCFLAPAGDQMKICLALLDQGEIVADFTSLPLTQEEAMAQTGPRAMLAARDAQGRTTTVKAPFGFDRVITAPGGYYVMAANRENDIPKSFDTVYLVMFKEEGPVIKPIIEGRGFGRFSAKRSTWLYVPHDDAPAKWTLKEVGTDGKAVDEFRFGAQLAARPDFPADGFLMDAEVMVDGDNVLLSVFKPGYSERTGPFVHYVVSIDKKMVGTRKE